MLGAMRRRRRRPVEPVQISKTIESQLRRMGVDPPLPFSLIKAWIEAVGPYIARVSRPARIRGKTLFVHVSTNSWMAEIQMLAPSILARIADLSPVPKVGRLRLKLASEPMFVPESFDRPPEPAPAPQQEVVIPELLARALQAIDDEELRAVVTRAIAATLAR
jgi:hypothetical protein